MQIAILIIIIFVLLVNSLKWKISTLSIIYYLEKNQYKRPSDKDLKECTGFVVKNMLKDLTGR